jgi:transposase-like protein
MISQAVWLYFRFPLSLHLVEEMLAGRGIIVTRWNACCGSISCSNGTG